MRYDDGPIPRLFGGHDLRMEAVFAPRLLRPGANGAPSMNVASFVPHDRILGEARRDTVRIVGIGSGKVFGKRLWQDHVTTPFESSSTRQWSHNVSMARTDRKREVFIDSQAKERKPAPRSRFPFN